MIVGKPGEFYLSHFFLKHGKGHTIAKQIHSIIANTDLEHKLILVATDGAASMTGHTNGCVAWLEHMLHRPLQWAVWLLHCNKLPLCHVFITIDSSTKSPDTFCEPIGKQLDSCRAV